MPADLEEMTKSMAEKQREFTEQVGKDGLDRLGKIVLKYLVLADEGKTAEMKKFRQKEGRVTDLGHTAQSFLDKCLDDVDVEFRSILM